MRAPIRWVFLVLVLVTGWSLGQPPPERPPADKSRALEDLIAAALRHSPDLQVADTKVREAQAELRRTRLTTVQKVIDANSAVETARAALSRAEDGFKEYSNMKKSGALSPEEFRAQEAKFIAAKTVLAQAESALNALTGALPAGIGNVGAVDGPPAGPNPPAAISGGTMPGGIGISGLNGGLGGIGGFPAGINGIAGGISGIAGGGFQGGFGGGISGTFTIGNGAAPPPPRVPSSAMSDTLRAALNVSIKVKPVKDMPLADVVSSYQHAAGVPFLLHLGDKGKEPVSLSLEGDVRLGAVFQALEDVVPGLKCYVREYGILATLDETQPEGAMPLIEFWQRKPAGK
jgi:hypothetical protein